MNKYLYRNRPPWIGTQPDGYEEYEAWRPPHGHESGREGQHFHGVVTYPEPLMLEQIHRYELWPVDQKVRAEYVFWLEGDDSGWLRENYMSQPVDKLREYAGKGDQKAAAALVLKGEV